MKKTTKYEIYWKGHISKRIHGVGIAVKIDPGIDIKDIKYISARIISMDVIVYGCSLKIVNAYAPTEGDSESMKNTFYRQLKNEISNLAPNQKIVCAGDFNATTSASWSNSSLRENSIINNLEVNNNGERFHELFDTCRLSVLNTWFHHKRCRRVTWYSADGVTEKVYDFILTDSWLRQYCLNCRVYRSFDFDSDHRLVIATMNTPLTKKARYRKRTVKKKAKNLDLATFNNDENLQLNFLQSTITNLNSKPLDDATNSTTHQHIVESINQAAENEIPKLVNPVTTPPWHNDQKLKDLFEHKNSLIAKNADKAILSKARKKIRLRARYLKNQHFKAEADKINDLAINRKLQKLFQRAKKAIFYS
ncbi:craniofacial development protein 2-like [Clytia hemisphaerica]|uniref:craniofacial development protein 2-like n=1 Tax=Clytia hemisphaerica TaxID=252671 RepID=UPI0034D3F2B3